jgi:hypothetical protein
MSDDVNEHEAQIVHTLRRRLQKLEEQAAHYGPKVEPSIPLEIEDLKERISAATGESFVQGIPGVDLQQLLSEYQAKHPLPTLEALLERLPLRSIKLASVSPLHNAPAVTKPQELLNLRFEAGYIVALTLKAQFEEVSVVEVRCRSSLTLSSAATLAYGLARQGFGELPVAFDKQYRKISLVSDSLEEVDDRVHFQLYFSAIYPQVSDVYVLNPSKVGVNASGRYETVFESKLIDSLPPAFPLALKNVDKAIEADISVQYRQIRQRIQSKLDAGVVNTPAAVLDTVLNALTIESWGYKSRKVLLNGMKCYVSIAPAYALYYTREVEYVAGMFKKQRYQATLKGHFKWAGSDKLVDATETVARKSKVG